MLDESPFSGEGYRSVQARLCREKSLRWVGSGCPVLCARRGSWPPQLPSRLAPAQTSSQYTRTATPTVTASAFLSSSSLLFQPAPNVGTTLHNLVGNIPTNWHN